MVINKRFQRFEEPLWLSGLVPKGAQIIDASLVSVPKNRNTRDENKQLKADKTAESWDEKPNMKRQGCSLEQEARQRPLRIQESHQH